MIRISASNGKIIVPGHGSCICVSEDDIVDLNNESVKSMSIEEFFSDVPLDSDLKLPEVEPEE